MLRRVLFERNAKLKSIVRHRLRRTPSRIGLIVAAVIGLQCHQVMLPFDGGVAVVAERLYASGPMTSQPSVTVTLAQRDPEAFLRHCRTQYDRNVRDYTCTFIKQESISHRVRAPERIAIHFRENPFSVDMEWIENPIEAARALYVEDAWRDAKGRPLAWFKPSGAILKLFVAKIQQPIHGARAMAASRRALDDFGFRRTLDLIILYNERGRKDGVLDLRYVGEGTVHGRPSFIFERHLPYSGTEEPYPDALLRFHIDQEWLVPTACYSYADHDGDSLLGSYVLTNVQFNVGLSDDHFDPKKLGF